MKKKSVKKKSKLQCRLEEKQAENEQKKVKKKRVFCKHTNAETGLSWPKYDKKKKVVLPKTKRKYKHHKLTDMPAFYQANFMARLHKGSELFYHLSTSYEQILADLGGIEKITRLELTIIERLVFTEYLCRKKEVELLESEDFSDENIQAVTRLGALVQSLATKLGVTRRADTDTDSLKEYLEDKTE